MKSNATPKITPLSEDLLAIVKSYAPALEMVQFLRDHSDPLLLPDEKPVLNINQDEFLGIFDLNFNHYFLPAEQVPIPP